MPISNNHSLLAHSIALLKNQSLLRVFLSPILFQWDKATEQIVQDRGISSPRKIGLIGTGMVLRYWVRTFISFVTLFVIRTWANSIPIAPYPPQRPLPSTTSLTLRNAPYPPQRPDQLLSIGSRQCASISIEQPP